MNGLFHSRVLEKSSCFNENQIKQLILCHAPQKNYNTELNWWANKTNIKAAQCQWTALVQLNWNTSRRKGNNELIWAAHSDVRLRIKGFFLFKFWWFRLPLSLHLTISRSKHSKSVSKQMRFCFLCTTIESEYKKSSSYKKETPCLKNCKDKNVFNLKSVQHSVEWLRKSLLCYHCLVLFAILNWDF